MAKTLLLGDFRVKHITSNRFKTKSFPEAKLSFFVAYVKNKKTKLENKYNQIILSAGINDITDKVPFENVVYRRNLFLKIKNYMIKIQDNLDIPVIFTTIVPRDLKKVASHFPHKCQFHSSVITEESQLIFERFINAVNCEVVDLANRRHGVHCPFHLDCRLSSSGRRRRRGKVLYDRLAANGLNPKPDLVMRWKQRVERLC